MLGEIALYSFIILLLTGMFLTLFFKPSQTEVVYNGSYVPLHGAEDVRGLRLDAATSRFDVRGGLLIRQIHHWAALIFVAAMIVHMCRVFFTGAFRKPREINWLIGVGLITLGIVEGLAGYSLPDDLLSGTGLRITEGVLLVAPGRRHLPVVLPVRRRVPGRGHHPAALHRPRPADPGHLPGADHRAPDARLVPEAHPVPAARAGPRRTSSATRSSRSTRPRPAASSSSPSA